MQLVSLEFPNGAVPLDSTFYIERPPIEQLIYQEISKPGSVIRIKAPKHMGKSSLLVRLIDYAKRSGYDTVYLDFLQADEEIFTSLDKILRWFCANVSRQLQLKPMLDDYWDEEIGSKVSCTIYFQGYLLSQIDSPLVLALNEVNRLFEYPKIAQEFLTLLRSWHEEAKQNHIFQKLRLVVVHSTEVYITLNIKQSPFNVGLPIQLPEFTSEQVLSLARRHGLNWTDGNVETRNFASLLMAMVGGHPYLVRLALYHLVNSDQKSLDQLLQEAPTITGIYHNYLQSHLATLQKNPELATALKKVITAQDGVQLDHILAYKLESMGLVKLDGNQCTLSCELYRKYFACQNLEERNLWEQLVQSQEQNQELLRLSNTDDLTQLANKRYFDIYLEQQWQILAGEMASLALIVLEIDYFKIYNDTHGYQAGNDCLRQFASAISNCVQPPNDLVARYGGIEFAIILPRTKASIAFKIAERIRREIKKLAVSHDSQVGGLPERFVTVSLGIACTTPNFKESPDSLVHSAHEALYQSNRKGRDRTYISANLILD